MSVPDLLPVFLDGDADAGKSEGGCLVESRGPCLGHEAVSRLEVPEGIIGEGEDDESGSWPRKFRWVDSGPHHQGYRRVEAVAQDLRVVRDEVEEASTDGCSAD